ncbi:MAG: alpha/beta fold hydrolase [Alphaproteobacteria bacterium]|nr:alpha/beta fold hydrolase [Alphaproteobacteria bacterium]MBU1560315.1 alpha/beta fold hydrolase [Alphaproteobacteria bacterium]MBU2303640.1 alpha/beta fold hydrolase [Alphaproteobacteria bacterium]MBU2366239.1 alpha/beta fold hydrolase [Alphaproteobacteria bacterium]
MASDLLLLPGLICDERLWRDVIAGLDARSVVADLTQDDSIGAMAQRALAAAPARFALAGLSMGGYVAFEIMRQAPERVTHLALFDTSARADDDARKETRRKGIEMVGQGKFIGVSRGLLGSLVAPQHMGTPVAGDVQAMSERVGQAAYMRQQVAIMNRVDSRPTLGDIQVPTLVGVGESDKLTPPELAEEMAAGIAGAELVRFPDSAHLPTMENPSAVVEAMKAWLAR